MDRRLTLRRSIVVGICGFAASWLPHRLVMACERLAPWSRLADTAAQYAAPLPLALSAGAVVAPILMAPSGADHAIRVLGQRDLGGMPNAEPVTVFTPYVLSGALVVVDAFALPLESCEVARPTSAMLQAFALTLGTVTLLKWSTGRAWPNAGRDPNAADRLEHPEFATRFHPFTFSQGTAWPSGHTATMMAIASSLSTVTYHRSWIGYVAYLATLGVATGMWLGDHHWGSDILSGGLLGFSIGHSVGLAFRQSESPAATAITYSVVPWSRAGSFGLTLHARF